MCLSLLKETIFKYTTFGGETDFTIHFLVPIGAAILALVPLQFSVLQYQVAANQTNAIILASGILVALLLLLYWLKTAGRYTLVPRFHRWSGPLLIAAVYLFSSFIAVGLMYAGFSRLIPAFTLSQLTTFDLLLGTGTIVLTAFAPTVTNLQSLRTNYPSLAEINTTFEDATTEATNKIQTTIEGIGHIQRTETRRIRDRLTALENVIVTGEGGVGKSGVLAHIAEEWNSQVLYLDASAHSAIESKSDLANRLGLYELSRPIQRVSINQTLLLIVDQLDDVGPAAGQAIAEFILESAEYSNTPVAFACRTHDLENRREYEELNTAESFSTKRPIGLLDAADASDHLTDLTGSNPSEELVELGRKVEHLDIIAQLAREGTDFDDISGEVALWEGYRELLEHEEQIDDDSRRGSSVVERAVEYAEEAIEDSTDSVNIFSVSVDQDWADRQLINRQVIVQASNRPGERKYRFRHLGFQRYLYAWDAVQENRSITDVTTLIDERLGKDVFRFMFILYLREGGADHIREIPEGSDASEFAKEFLREALDENDGLGDYTAKNILDEVKTWDAAENEELTDVVLEKLEERETLYNYFFSNPPHPSWAIALRERGKFENPPDVLLQYLMNLAPEHPDIVSDVLPAVETDDRHTLALVVVVIRELPVEYAEELLHLVQESVTDTQPDWHSFQSVELMQELVESGETEAGMELLESLLQPREPLEGEPGTVQPVSDLYDLKSAFDDILPSLVESEGEQLINLLESRLEAAIEVEAEIKGRDMDTVTGPLHTDIGGADFEDTTYSNFKNLLIGTLLAAVEQWIEANPADESRPARIEQFLDDITLFNRIGLHLLNQYKEHFQPLVRRELLNEENYGELWVKEDFLRLLRDGYPILPEPDQQRVLDIITSVPVRETLEEGARQRSEELDEYTAEELAEESVDRWVRDRLWVIRDHLPQEKQEELDRLVNELGEPDNVLSFISTRGGFVSQESPLSVEELEQRPPEQVIDYCIEEPFETTGWDETEAGELQEISSQGLAETVTQVILDNPNRFQQHIPRLQEASSVYARELFDGLREKIEDSEYTEFDWTPFLKLGETVVSNPEHWTAPARKSVARLLREAYGNDDHEAIYNHNDHVKQLLFTLINDPDPDEEREHPPEGHAGYNNPLHVALNSVRPIGVDALLIFAGKTAQHRGYRGYSEEDSSGFDPDIREQVQTIINTASLSIRSTIGRRLHLLWYLDHPIVQENLSTLFPRSQSTRDKTRFAAAWDAYVASHPPHEDLYPRLRACYLHGIDLMTANENTAISGADDGLVRHLLSAYLRDMEDLSADDSLIVYLYEQDEPDMARQIAWQLWRWGNDSEEIRDEWEKVKRLWEWRLTQVEGPERYAPEFQWFVEWVPLVEDQITFEAIVDLLEETTPFIAFERRSWETLESYLADRANTHPEEAIQIYTELIEQDARPSWIEFSDNTTAILEAGVAAGGTTEHMALDIAEDYFSRGYDDAEAFLDEHT